LGVETPREFVSDDEEEVLENVVLGTGAEGTPEADTPMMEG
jgi:hypothetical protein